MSRASCRATLQLQSQVRRGCPQRRTWHPWSHRSIREPSSPPSPQLISENMTQFSHFFVPEIFENQDTKFKYTPVGIAAPDVLLEDLTGLKLNGMYPQQIYKELIKPKLK